MADVTHIQWADSTVNPIVGCGGCELYPPAAQVFSSIDQAVAATGYRISSRKIYEEAINRYLGGGEDLPRCLKKEVDLTHIWHFQSCFTMALLENRDCSLAAMAAAKKAIEQSIACHAALIHLKHGKNPAEADVKGHRNLAPFFESVTSFPGRAEHAAKLKDLLGCSENRSPWKANLPRLIFVSELGDAMSGTGHFPFLKEDVMSAILSEAGKRHLWLWLTKRPAQLAQFAEEIGGFPENVCAMTTLTSSDKKNLERLAALKKVNAHVRGLSIEPLWSRIPPKQLDLNGIDWVIVGGASGKGQLIRPFQLEWAEELRDCCRKNRVAFFLKQLGRNPISGKTPIELKDKHGGNWDEWPDENLKVREFPKAFHRYRNNEKKRLIKQHSVNSRKLEIVLPPPTAEEKAEFKSLDEIVNRGIKAFVDAGAALAEIRNKKLWPAGGYVTWESYCRAITGKSRVYAHRLMRASQCVIDLQAIADVSVLPKSESQVRPLLRLKEPEKRKMAWDAAVKQADNKQPTAVDVKEVVDRILTDEAVSVLPKKKPITKTQKRREIASKIHQIITQRESWEDLETWLEELEKTI
jgi:protein gp37